MPITRERLLEIAEKHHGIDVTPYRQAQGQESLIQKEDPLSQIINAALGGASNYGKRLIGETPKDTSGDLTSDILKTVLGERVKQQIEGQEGFATQDEIPKESGGLPLKTVKFSKGRYIPEYGYSRPLVQFGGFDPNQFNEPEDEDEKSQPFTIEQPEDEYSDEQLEAFRQEAITQGMTPQEIAQIDAQRQSTRQKDVIPAGSVTPTQEGIQAAIDAGFTQKEIDNFLQAYRRQRGQ